MQWSCIGGTRKEKHLYKNLFFEMSVGPEKDRFIHVDEVKLGSYAFFSVFLGRSTAWILGRTPPWAIVTPLRSLFNSSSFLMAS